MCNGMEMERKWNGKKCEKPYGREMNWNGMEMEWKVNGRWNIARRRKYDIEMNRNQKYNIEFFNKLVLKYQLQTTVRLPYRNSMSFEAKLTF